MTTCDELDNFPRKMFFNEQLLENYMHEFTIYCYARSQGRRKEKHLLCKEVAPLIYDDGNLLPQLLIQRKTEPFVLYTEQQLCVHTHLKGNREHNIYKRRVALQVEDLTSLER